MILAHLPGQRQPVHDEGGGEPVEVHDEGVQPQGGVPHDVQETSLAGGGVWLRQDDLQGWERVSFNIEEG